MKFNNPLPVGVTRNLSQLALKAEKHSPRILFVAGVTGMVATTVLACKATLKLEEVLDEAQDKLGDIRTLEHAKYSETDRKQDKAIVYVQTFATVGRLYAPAVIVGSLSVLALTKSHTILTQRNAALTAAYVAVDKAFKEYRARVADEFGEEKEREIRYAAEKTSITVEDTNGKKKKTVMKPGPNGASMYAKFFDQTNKNWERTPEYNIMFIRNQQNWLNDKLRKQGHVTLNDAYDMLGLERTSAGQIVGWIWGSESGDNHIDFGIFTDKMRDQLHDFVVGAEGSILLDFNVDGPIWEEIG